MTIRLASCLGLALIAATFAAARDFSIKGPDKDIAEVVIRVPAGKDTPATANAVELSPGGMVPAQFSGPNTDAAGGERQLVFVVPAIKAGQETKVKPVTVNHVAAPPAFRFSESKDGFPELAIESAAGKRPILQYFNPKRDPADHYYTFKPFHNLFDP
ncbi:MAG: hypothetical protein KJS91_12505, partial [Planctomycetes bacterium]|nr:hypothetical protein [Planctomycetota bacterium]